jgi:hypothetical protein
MLNKRNKQERSRHKKNHLQACTAPAWATNWVPCLHNVSELIERGLLATMVWFRTWIYTAFRVSMFVYQVYVHMYGFFKKYHVLYLFICAVCCMHVCVSSIFMWICHNTSSNELLNSTIHWTTHTWHNMNTTYSTYKKALNNFKSSTLSSLKCIGQRLGRFQKVIINKNGRPRGLFSIKTMFIVYLMTKSNKIEKFIF